MYALHTIHALSLEIDEDTAWQQISKIMAICALKDKQNVCQGKLGFGQIQNMILRGHTGIFPCRRRVPLSALYFVLEYI